MSGTHGGKRAGAGRPKKLDTALAEAKETLDELQTLVKSGLRYAAIKFPALIEEELKTALDDPDKDRAMKARQFLIRYLLEAIKLRDLDDSPIRGIMTQWNIEGDLHVDVAGKGSGPVIDAPHRVVAGAE